MNSIEKYATRQFTMERYTEVFGLWQSCEGIGLSDADRPEKIESYLKRNPGMSFIVLDEATVIGSILAGHDGRRGYIHHLAVHPGYRRRGIATHLAGLAVASLQEAGIGKCHLFIYTANKSGIAFWEAAGWTFRMEISLISRDIGPDSNGVC